MNPRNESSLPLQPDRETLETLRKRAIALASKDGAAGAVGASGSAAETQAVEMLEFRLANERYAVETRLVRAVYPLKNLTAIPCTPDFVRGVVNLRGQITTVISLEHFFNLPEQGLTDLHRIVLVGNDEMELGLLADVSVGVVQVDMASIQRDLQNLAAWGGKYVQGVTQDGLIVLDMDGILSDPGLLVNEEVGSR